jgi:protein-tyrosine-phosphatase
MKPTILFLCPHGAAKSVMAAAYAQHFATQYDLDLQITSAGTEPDPEVAPAVAALLQSEGIDVSAQIPRRLTQADIDSATWIISLGCELDDFVSEAASITSWHDVPPPSQALMVARDLIYARTEQFIRDLKMRA